MTGDATVRSDVRGIVLVEGASDHAALATLAERRGRDLEAEGIAIVAMGGAGGIGDLLQRFGPTGRGLRVAGVYDAGEEDDVRRGLGRAGFGAGLTRTEMEQRGFFVCVLDLEDELIRALGPPAVEAVIEARGELAALRTFQKQPAQRDRPVEHQLRRFLGTRSGRKIEYGRLLTQALELDRVPRPLDAVLAYV